MSNAEPWLTTEQIAAHLGKEPSYVWANAEQLGIPRVKVGRQWRYKISQVDAWLEALQASR